MKRKDIHSIADGLLKNFILSDKPYEQTRGEIERVILAAYQAGYNAGRSYLLYNARKNKEGGDRA